MQLTHRSSKETSLKILRYLELNPEAMDSEKGISSWWVQDEPKNIHSALLYLVSRKILETKEINGEVYYFLNETFRNGIFIRDLVLSVLGKQAPRIKKPDNPKRGR